MKRCQRLLEESVHHSVVRLLRRADQIKTLSLEQKNAYFVIPEEEKDVIRRIRERYQNCGKIYLPRAVIGALCHYQIRLPVRSFTISLSMHECHVFLSIGSKTTSKEEEKRKERERDELSKRVLEMGGTIVPSWKQRPINVVVTDSASSKHSISAYKENLPVVSRNWVDEIYAAELNQEYHGDEQHFNALSSVDRYRIKPFYGLHFKIALTNVALQKEAKNLIIENHGQVIYGDEDCLTHVVRQEKDIKLQQMNKLHSQGKKNLHFVGMTWLKRCTEEGRYIGIKDFKILTQSVKQERDSPECTIIDECFTPSPTPPESQTYNNDENNYHKAMPPPPPQTILPPPRPQRQQQTAYSMSDDMILKSLFADQQTVHASTQIRGLPDPELHIEQIYEPSQQLYWNDAQNS